LMGMLGSLVQRWEGKEVRDDGAADNFLARGRLSVQARP
jgi:hypothetical protein